jgi:hypothetical protein
MTDVIRHTAAVHGETLHRHHRTDGRGVVEHQHTVRSEIHGHLDQGLRAIRLRWLTWKWSRFGGAAIYMTELMVWIALAFIAFLGWLFFALKFAR